MIQKEALQFLDSLIDYEKVTTYTYDAMKLDRMQALLRTLGNPQDSFRSVHIAGSRGKGSTAAMVYSILREAGYCVGLYTSPHLISRNERIRVAGKNDADRTISEEELALLVRKVKPAVEALSKEGAGGFTFFEVFTALSFLYFKERGVEIAILEAGMGGRLDATNVVQPVATAITPISYDHMDKLGGTLTHIACEKAQILKRGAAAVISHQDAEPLAEIRRVAKEKGIDLLEVPSLYSSHVVQKGEEGTHFHVRGPKGEISDLFLSLLGEHQVRNALVAIAICDSLGQKGLWIDEAFIRKGLLKVDWPGRFQVVEKDPVLILDGAQNGASAAALKETVLGLFENRPLCLILGISANKEVDAVCKILCPLAKTVIVTEAKSVRAMRASELREHALPYSKSLRLASSLQEALAVARQETGPEGVILATGSLYLVGEALALLENEENERMGRERMGGVRTPHLRVGNVGDTTHGSVWRDNPMLPHGE